MKDVERDEIELKLYRVLMSDWVIPVEVLEALREALTYVQNNPTVSSIEMEMLRLEEDGYSLEDNVSLTTVDYHTALIVMEKHA